jgi:O-antigen/teichoic acid export membrane protein
MPLPKAKSNPLLSNSFFIFITRFFPSMANLLVVIWYSRHLPQAQYGNYQHFWIQLYVIYPLACWGIHVLIITYSPQVIRKLVGSINAMQYTMYAVWLVLLSAVFAGLQYSALGITFIVPFLFILCFSVSAILESVIIVCRNYTLLTIISILYSVAYWLIHFYILKQGFSLNALFTYLLIITALRLCIYAGMAIISLSKIKGGGDVEGRDKNKIRHLWLHLGLYDVVQILFSWIDKFIISFVLTAPLSAIYFNGSQNIPVLPLLLSAAGSAVLMQLASGRQEDEQRSMVQLMNRSGRVLSCIVFPVFFYLLFFRQELIIALFGDKYIAAIPVFALSILVLPVKAYSFTTVLQRMHKGAIINAGAIADLLLACALMYPLYRWLGLPGVALSFVISTYLQAGFYLYYSAKLLNISPLKLVPYANWCIKLIVFATVFIIIRYVGNLYFTGKIGLILGGVAMAALIVVSLLMEFISQKKYGGH